MKKNKKPVILITGYLGSGKTTLLNNILKQEKRKVALIVNDMGSINVDAEILKKNGSNVTECPMFELQNGCICCTLRDEFIQQIEKISNLDSIEVIFVEASGISDPGAVSASFLAYEDENPNTNVYLTSIVTVVDADRIYREFLSDLKLRKDEMFNDIELSQEEISTLIVDQIEFCNFIVLNKCDLLSEDQLKEVESIVRDFQTRAPIIRSVNAEIDIDKIMTKKPFNRERFMEFVNNRYPTQLIRSKGYIWFSDCSRDVQLFEQAGRNSSVMPVSYWIDALQEDVKQSYIASNPELKENWDSRFGDRENQVVFIGRGYNKDEIMLKLEKCLDERAIA